MAYLCKHGYMLSSCSLCCAIEEAIEDFMMNPATPVEDNYGEMLYDHYLEMDERVLRESEEN